MREISRLGAGAGRVRAEAGGRGARRAGLGGEEAVAGQGGAGG